MGAAAVAAPLFSMTNLNRNVSRRTRFEYSVLFSKRAKIVVTLALGDILIFREERRRRRWALPIDIAFFYAVRRQADYDRAERRARKKRPSSAD